MEIKELLNKAKDHIVNDHKSYIQNRKHIKGNFGPTKARARNLAKAEGKKLSDSAGSGVFANPVDMTIVQQKVSDFQFKMKELAIALKDAPSFLQLLDLNNFYTQFYIDRPALARLNAIAAQQEFDNFGVFFGLEDPATQLPLSDPKAAGFGRLTCCFVGLDSDYNVLSSHFPTGTVPAEFEAEETWPPPPPAPGVAGVFDLTSDTTAVSAYFDPQ